MNDKLYKYNNINFIIEIFESQKFIIRPLPEKCQWFNLPVIISFYYIYLDKKKILSKQKPEILLCHNQS